MWLSLLATGMDEGVAMNGLLLFLRGECIKRRQGEAFLGAWEGHA